jgi:hypothetical protein
LSAAFAGPPKGEKLKNGKAAARCEELLAVDCVPMPAANPAGLFSALVDSEQKENLMDQKEANQATEPTLTDVIAALQQVQETVNAVANRQAEIDALIEANTPLSAEELEQLAAMSDEELAAQGIDRTEVNEAIAAYNAAVEAGEGDEAEGEAGEAEAAPAEAAAPAGAALSALRKRVVELEAKLAGEKEDKESAEIMHAFDVLEQKQAALIAQNEALQRTIRLQGIKAATPGTESFRMFSADQGDDKVTEFDRLVSAKATELESQGKAKAAARAEAIRFTMKSNPRSYAEHNAARGIVTLADK